MKKIIKIIISVSVWLLIMPVLTQALSGCAGTEPKLSGEYKMITPKEAKEIMDKEKDYVILDVRTESEYNTGHIKGTVLIPDFEIKKRAPSELPDKDRMILVYCRSGNRSKSAAKTLANMGYTNIYEFGGILDWPYDIVK